MMQKVKLDRIIADERNPRVHDEANLQAIRDSLERYGQVEPLVVQKGSMRLIGGHGRLQAMQGLGWSTASVNVVDLNDAEADALNIALNRTAELAYWDEDRLRTMIDGLRDGDQLVAPTGFNVDDLASLFPKEGDDDTPSSGSTGPALGAVRYSVQVFVDGETAQAELIERLEKEGLECNALMS